MRPLPAAAAALALSGGCDAQGAGGVLFATKEGYRTVAIDGTGEQLVAAHDCGPGNCVGAAVTPPGAPTRYIFWTDTTGGKARLYRAPLEPPGGAASAGTELCSADSTQGAGGLAVDDGTDGSGGSREPYAYFTTVVPASRGSFAWQIYRCATSAPGAAEEWQAERIGSTDEGGALAYSAQYRSVYLSGYDSAGFDPILRVYDVDLGPGGIGTATEMAAGFSQSGMALGAVTVSAADDALYYQVGDPSSTTSDVYKFKADPAAAGTPATAAGYPPLWIFMVDRPRSVSSSDTPQPPNLAAVGDAPGWLVWSGGGSVSLVDPSGAVSAALFSGAPSGAGEMGAGPVAWYVPNPKEPTAGPSAPPSAAAEPPSVGPTESPAAPSMRPSLAPSAAPLAPSTAPLAPSMAPAVAPLVAPTKEPLMVPTVPTVPPSALPAPATAAAPSAAPSGPPDAQPSTVPSAAPAPAAAALPTAPPVAGPTPTTSPVPGAAPPTAPPVTPGATPTGPPVVAPAGSPSTAPSVSPIAAAVAPTAPPVAAGSPPPTGAAPQTAPPTQRAATPPPSETQRAAAAAPAPDDSNDLLIGLLIGVALCVISCIVCALLILRLLKKQKEQLEAQREAARKAAADHSERELPPPAAPPDPPPEMPPPPPQPPSSCLWEAGDNVEVIPSAADLQRLCSEGACGWNEGMSATAGMQGVVRDVHPSGSKVKVELPTQGEPIVIFLPPTALCRAGSPSVGDQVSVTDEDELHRLCQKAGCGWADGVAALAGGTGKVVSVSPDKRIAKVECADGRCGVVPCSALSVIPPPTASRGGNNLLPLPAPARQQSLDGPPRPSYRAGVRLPSGGWATITSKGQDSPLRMRSGSPRQQLRERRAPLQSANSARSLRRASHQPVESAKAGSRRTYAAGELAAVLPTSGSPEGGDAQPPAYSKLV